jgi:hypothetical protein
LSGKEKKKVKEEGCSIYNNHIVEAAKEKIKQNLIWGRGGSHILACWH